MSPFTSLARFLRLIPTDDPSSIIRNVAYFTGSDAHVNHKLDIFLPPTTSPTLLTPSEEAEPEKKVPIILHVHGGGWVRGSRTNEWRGGPVVGRASAQEGFVGVVVSYRLARISPTSLTAWTVIFGLILLIIAIPLRSWQLVTGYAVFMIIAYSYNFLFRVRTPVHLEHVRTALDFELSEPVSV
jgi:hypothetical protein